MARELATARSVVPPPLKSPAAIATGKGPTAYVTCCWKVPLPLPSKIDTSLESEFTAARSVVPSPVKVARP